jgi:hypothetical protein
MWLDLRLQATDEVTQTASSLGMMATSTSAIEVRGPAMVERQQLSGCSVDGGDGGSSMKWERRKEGGEKNRGKERCRRGEKS